ncbi:Carboxylesterase type B [Penicillium coprophilum]|uniref:Carboxylesterase type B n=1 Tax=Penicillium coprophilum TaxID=36646 RepID=UPI00238F9C31|nr:Carboxylesterase type B [Penicillium coprophilum]KAJ5154780.1 Carboxylesterase type B [Penicillium coprophilum]
MKLETWEDGKKIGINVEEHNRQLEEHDAKRERMIEREIEEIPWWVEYEKDDKNELTFEEQKSHIEELKKALDTCWIEIKSRRNNFEFFHGFYDFWPELHLSRWESEVHGNIWSCRNWATNNGIKTRRSGKCQSLSKEQKRDVIVSLKGWVVQDDFDRTVSKLPPCMRYIILAEFAAMIVIKDCLRLFFTNPFWYLDPHGEFASIEGPEETPLGAQLHALYKEFLKVRPDLAHHWRNQTSRLSNMKYNGHFQAHDTTFALANEELRKAKAYEFAAARLQDKTFRCLLQEKDENELKESLGYVYFCMSELAKSLSTSQPDFRWRLLDEIPTEFKNKSKVFEAAFLHGHDERELRLNGRKVLAITQPYFYETGGWDQEGVTRDATVRRARVMVEDPAGQPGFTYSSDEDAHPRKRKRQPKKAKVMKKSKDDTEPTPKGRAKTGAKKKI